MIIFKLTFANRVLQWEQNGLNIQYDERIGVSLKMGRDGTEYKSFV